MISKSLLSIIVADQRDAIRSMENYVERDARKFIPEALGSNTLIVKGLRRSGKSTMLTQEIIKRFGDDYLYFNFDDDRIMGFTTEDFQTLLETEISQFGDKKHILLDEIQNVKKWELFVNRLIREGYAVLITGSNSNLLSAELGTHLTGRHIDLNLTLFHLRNTWLLDPLKLILLDIHPKKRSMWKICFNPLCLKGGCRNP